MFSKKIIILIFILFSALAVFAVVFLNDEYSASARRAAFEADRTRYMSDILRITNGVAPVLWIEPKYSYENNGKYFDLSGNANHATQSTEANQPTVSPPGLKFDGGNDYLDCGDVLDFNISDAFTLMAWIKTDMEVSNVGDIINKQNHSSPYNGYCLTLNASEQLQLEMIESHTTKSLIVKGNTSLSDNIWHYVVGVYDGSNNASNMKLYIDGKEISITIFYNNPNDNTATSFPLQIGTRNNQVANFLFNGSIDSVRIYNIALTAAQIQNLYLAGLPGHR